MRLTRILKIPMDLAFDFRLHADCSTLMGTQYFELAPGRYTGQHWATGARFIHEHTFSLIEGIFERQVPDYDHFAFVDVSRPTCQLILRDLTSLRVALEESAEGARVSVPFGGTLKVQSSFEQALESNQRVLATLLADLESWLHHTLADHDEISALGL